MKIRLKILLFLFILMTLFLTIVSLDESGQGKEAALLCLSLIIGLIYFPYEKVFKELF